MSKAKQRPALGKGLGALISKMPEKEQAESQKSVTEIKLNQIKLNPNQPRSYFTPEKLEELAQSIRIKGVIQPVIVRYLPNREYELIAGERRIRASKLAGRDTIPAVVRDTSDSELLEVALIENIQREDLNPIEEGQAYHDLIIQHGYTQENLAKRVGKSRSTIANLIRLLQLPEFIQEDLLAERLSMGHSRALLALEDEEGQKIIRDQIISKDLSVRETEKLIKNYGLAPEKTPKRIDLSPQMKLNQTRLMDVFSTNVQIKAKGNKGKIEIEYSDSEQFNRIYELLIKNQ